MRTTRVFDLAHALAVAAGTRARVSRLPGGGYRVDAPLPAGLATDVQLVVLAVLQTADRYGHQYSDTAQSVWAEIDDDREAGQVTSTKAGSAFTVSIEDITEPATFSRLPEALAALWESLRVLPLGWTQYEAYRYFFGPGAVERVEEFLERDGELNLSFTMSGRPHAVRVRRAG